MTGLDLSAEAVLDPDIQFSDALCAHWERPNAVFLTGATGFLGCYLLSELLLKTHADVYCLIRSDDVAAARQRVQRQLQFYQLWSDSLDARIIPVVGDLSKPRLGLSDKAFAELAARIDVIYHNGAQVNAMSSYARLKASNVLGTQEVLRLAGLTQTKPVHFISTLAVFFSDANIERIVSESDRADAGSDLKGGYKQSKWVAEQLVKQAQERGLPATIFRCGRIWGSSTTGIMNRFGDLLCTLVQCGLHLGAYPEAETTLNIVPVDYVSRAIVSLGQQQQSLGDTFHLSNPHSISWLNLWRIIASLGYALEPVSLAQWKETIRHRSALQRDVKVYSVVHHLLRSPIYLFAEKPHFDTSRTMLKLADSGAVCPPIDAKIMATYLSGFQRNEYIPLPQRDMSSNDLDLESNSA